MARYCIAYDSMKQFLEIKGKESLSDLVSSFSSVVLFIYSPIIVKVGILNYTWAGDLFLEEIPNFIYQLNY